MSCLPCAIFIKNITDYRINSFSTIMSGYVKNIDDNYIYVRSQGSTFLIERESVKSKLTVGTEVQFQTEKKRAPVLVKKYCFYKRYYIAELLD